MQSASGLTALLVEDEELVRNYVEHVLTQAGFHVLKAESHARALEIFLSQQVDFVVADWRLPDKNGEALLDYFQGVRPSLPFLLISGANPNRPHLAKPFTPTELITAVWGILGPLPSLP
ncbi:MAG: response regulator [Candidatus Eremiobacteraeota bacterium]|nr:response regulator [Candidatus Eremiobacteraeota bacterium]MCW5868016.1 response regulator [Candidatus Eremiobacteraeota bacterium]